MSRTVRLRPWQHAALAAFERTARPDFLAVATPGAGKTTFALAALRTVLAARPGRVVVVAPTAHLKLQWAHAGVRLGLQLEPGWTPAGGELGGPAEQLSMFAALSAVAIRESAAWSPWQEPLPDAWSDMTDPTIEIELGPLPRLGGVDAETRPGVSRHERRERLRTMNAEVARELVRATGMTHAQVNLELDRLAGVGRIAEATIEQLEARLASAWRWRGRLAR